MAVASDSHIPRVLVVEDTVLLADLIADELEEEGCQVVGPVGRLEQALALAGTEALDGALLDVNLAGERCFPIADRLAERGIPFVFLTGYSETIFPSAYREAPRLTKPFPLGDLARLIDGVFRRAG
jgi:DNA-binding response OmpR family regulator